MCQILSESYRKLIGQLQRLTLVVESLLNGIFSQKFNPFYYHGALPNFFLWVLFVSGLLLFAYYNPTLEGAWPSIAYITEQIPSGALFRAMHRYAADGMMIFVLLHFFRVWFTDRYREYRILPWMTGVILVSVLFLAGLTGYMLIWDAESVALSYMTINALNALPVIGHPLATLLVGGTVFTDFTLTRYLFLHLSIPSLMLFLLWWHYLRITRPVTNAPLVLNLMMFGGILLASGMMPLDIGAQPNLTAPSMNLDVDWLYMLPQGLMAGGIPAQTAWFILIAIPLAMLLLPYIQKKQFRTQYAHVITENCTGCSLCYHDCPYEAIVMMDRDDDSKFKRIAIVDAGRCSNCGLCVGACAFKAIEIPRMPTESVFQNIQTTLAGSPT
jgi:quinol-cytochrome oxidoreductase complex cytochrome b subunit